MPSKCHYDSCDEESRREKRYEGWQVNRGLRVPSRLRGRVRDRARVGRAGLDKVQRMFRPRVAITAPPPGVVLEDDVPVVVRDGTELRVDVFRPERPGRYPVLLCAHPYDKSTRPTSRRRGGYRIPFQYRVLSQDAPVSHSAWTSWEAPDPAFWVPRGYVVVNADLRGWGSSDGVGELFSAQEGDDGYDLVEWAGTQRWSNGCVGMTGVSYLAIVQWRIAATRPPHLAAINPWEGFTDLYRDFAMPGGVREDGFSIAWDRGLRARSHSPVEFRDNMLRRPLIDDWWRQRNPDLERVEVPALVCASFSDHCLHSRGSFEGFTRIGSQHKWLWTHRGPKWATYYSAEALEVQSRFFDHFLRGDNTGIVSQPRVRIEVRSEAHRVAEVVEAESWPPETVRPLVLHADAASHTLTSVSPVVDSTAVSKRGTVRLRWRFDRLTDVIGPLHLALFLSADAPDVTVFAGVRKYSGGREVGFEGSYGLTHDLVTHGCLRASHRGRGPARSATEESRLEHTAVHPLTPGQVARLDITLLPSATRFAAGDELELELRDRWLFPSNPFTGSLPARYDASRSRWRLHTGPTAPSGLTLPVRTDDRQASGRLGEPSRVRTA